MKQCHDILREMREDRDLKQSEIAERINTSQQQYSKYETGESELPLRALAVLADFYGVSADYLIGRKDDTSGVPGLDKKVTKEVKLKDMISDILSLGAAGRAAVLEQIYLQRIKIEYEAMKKKDGARP
ncbi:MAG TPA: XRE family transcriptional regulator [Clostridiales bacterium]|nr:XRE family transcriptional regulator [Clostridiales bacterium]